MLGPQHLVLSSVPIAGISLAERLEPARSAGFAGLSLLPADIWAVKRAGGDAREIAALFADNGLEIAEIDCIGNWLPSHAGSPPDHDMARLLHELTPQAVIAAAARVGARSVTVVEMLGTAPSIDEAGAAFAAICDRAADHGLIVHLEFLPFGGIPDLESAWRIVETAGKPNGALTIDAWHMARSGSTLEQLAAIPGPRIGSVQLSDGPAAAQENLLAETMTARLCPGEGAFDLAGLVRTLDEIGSRAPVGVEIFCAATAHLPLADLCQSWAHATRAILREARGRA